MKKFLLILILAAIAPRLNAQTPQTQTKPSNPPVKADSAKKQDNMPVIKPQGNSTIRVITPPGGKSNSNMPIVKPKTDSKEDNQKKAEPKQL